MTDSHGGRDLASKVDHVGRVSPAPRRHLAERSVTSWEPSAEGLRPREGHWYSVGTEPCDPSTAHRVGHAAAPRRSRPVSDRRTFDGDVETNQLAGATDQFELWRRGGLLAMFDR